MTSRAVIYLLLLLAPGIPAAAQEAPQPQDGAKEQQAAPETTAPKAIAWDAKDLDVPAIQAELARRAKELKDLPEGTPEQPENAPLRRALKQRTELLSAVLAALEKQASLATSTRDLLKNDGLPLEKIQQEIEEMESRPPPSAPAGPTPEGLEELAAKLKKEQNAASAAAATATERQQRLASIPQEIPKLGKREKDARELAAKLHDSAGSNTAQREGLAFLNADNALLDARTAVELQKQLDVEETYLKAAAPLAEAARKLEDARLERLQAEFDLYAKTLAAHQNEKQMQAEKELEEATQEAAEASSSFDAHIKDARASLARVKNNIASLETFKTELTAAVGIQRKERDDDEQFFKELKDTIRNTVSVEHAGAFLKASYLQIEPRRQALAAAVSPEMREKISEYQSRRFEINSILLNFQERIQKWLEQSQIDLPKEKQAEFRASVENLIPEFRRLLAQEQELLVDVTTEGLKLDLKIAERKSILDDLETYLLTRVFWIRDALPLGAKTFENAWAELASTEQPRSFIRWWKTLTASDTSRPLLESLRGPGALGPGLLLIVLPLALLWLHTRLRRYVVAQNRKAAAEGPVFRRQWTVALVAVLGAALIPGYLLALTWALGRVELQGSLGQVVFRLIAHFAIFLFFWLATRVLFSPGGISETQFRLPPAAAATLHRSLRVALVGFLLFLLPQYVFEPPPMEWVAVPRLGATAFGILVLVATFLLIRQKSPMVEALLPATTEPQAPLPEDATGIPRFLARNWWLISSAIVLFLAGVLALDIAGYRFGASYLYRNAAVTLATVVGLVLLARFVLPLVDHMLKNRRKLATRVRGSVRPGFNVEDQAKRFVRMLFWIVGAVFLVRQWQLNDRVFAILEDFAVYTIMTSGGNAEIVSVADLVMAVISMLATVWILRNLPGIYELTIFPRFKMDAGLRYALLTISRYTIFVVGVIFTLSRLHLDLGRIGWLVAAVSVGLGFGLQEIVANFVSGVILLVERPIRVGDVITVGTVTGSITRINIRATTVLNWDRQEILVPNRQLITQDVTNWTLHDTVTRVVIKIRVAHDSDVDVVRKMLLDAAAAQPDVLKDPAPQALFLNQWESCIDFELRVWLPETRFRLPTMDGLNTTINKKMKELGIRAGFPPRDVHLHGGDRPGEAPRKGKKPTP